MAILNSGAQSANGATAPVMDVNEVHNSRPRGRNKFPMNYLNFFTARFGELTPFFCFQTTEQDTISLAVRHETRSHTLSAPLMSGVKFVKDTFAVPYQAILPRNWDLIYKNPKFGDDVPADANSVVISGAQSVGSVLNPLFQGLAKVLNDLRDAPEVSLKETSDTLKALFSFEWFASAGSLLNLLGYHSHDCFAFSASGKATRYYSFDDVFERIMAELRKYRFSVNADGVSYSYEPDSAQIGYDQNSAFHSAVTAMRDNLDFVLTFEVGSSPNIFSSVPAMNTAGTLAFALMSSAPFNFAPLVAYQSVVAQLYTNDNIDDIYSWDLYVKAAETFLKTSANSLDFFNYNGVPMLYDVYSGHYFLRELKKMWTTTTSSGQTRISSLNVNSLLYLSTIFSIRHSLRLGDYFAGSRPNPLAIGDVTAPVVNSGVSNKYLPPYERIF